MHKKVANFVLLTVFAIAFFSGLSFWSQPPFDPDLGWHLFGGAEIFREHRVPSSDLINSFSTRWHDYHWLAQILMYAVFRLSSYFGLSIALGFVTGLTLTAVAAIAYRRNQIFRSPLLTVVAILFAAALLVKVSSVRPQAIALLIIALSLLQVSARETRGELVLLFLAAVLCANVHVYWVFVPIVYGIYRVIPAWTLRGSTPGKRWQKAGACALLCSAAFISPYGLFQHNGWALENYALIFDYLLMPEYLREMIGELKGSFSAGGSTPYLLCVAIAIFFRGFKRSDLRAERSNFIAALFGTILAIRAIKFLAIFSLLAFPYFLTCLVRVTRGLRTESLRPGTRASYGILSALLALSVGYSFSVFPRSGGFAEELDKYLPFRACARIADLPLTPSNGRDHVRVLTHFNYGGWCRWIMYHEAPQKDLRVTTDGRTQWFPPELFSRALDLYNARYEWLQTLRSWQPDAVLVSRDKPLANVLALAQKDWKLVYEDSSFAVFLPIAK